MPPSRKQQAKPESEKPSEFVLSSFAYATSLDGEVVQLVKGDVITDRFTARSIEHLRSIGFVGPKN